MSAALVTFCAFVAALGVKLTPGQLVLALIGVDGVAVESLTPEQRALAFQLFGELGEIPDAARMTLAIIKGARMGGSYVFGGLLMLYKALTVAASTLAHGETLACLSVGPDIRLGRIPVHFARGAAKAMPQIAKRITSESADGFVITRPDGQRVSLEALPSTKGGAAVRGRSLAFAVMTEGCFMYDDQHVVNDQDIYDALEPRILPGGMLVIESTPWVESESGLLYGLFKSDFANPTSAIVAHAPTLLMRDDLRTRAIVALARIRNPDNARREFDAEFMSGAGSGAFFDPATIDAAVMR